MEAIITAATVLTMYFNAVNSNDANFMYNGDIEDGRVNKIEVYERNDNQQMEQKVEYCYEYDEQGRLTSKEMLSWDDAKNAEKQQYELPQEVTLYRSAAPNLTTVKTYKMNEAKDNMFLTSSMIVMEPLDNRLLAQQ